MATLPTNFKDDILDTSVNTRRRYRMYENTDGTIELEDVTEYSQVGDEFGAGQINATNTEVNKKFDKNMIVRDLDIISAITKEGYVPDALALKEVNDSLTAQDSLKFQFATDGEGNYGYLKGDDTFVPFSSLGAFNFVYLSQQGKTGTGASYTYTLNVEKGKTYVVFPYNNNSNSGWSIVSNDSIKDVQTVSFNPHIAPTIIYKFTAIENTQVKFSYSGGASGTYSSFTAYYLE